MVHTQPSSLLCSVDSAKFFAAEMILAVEYMHAKRPAPPHPFMCTPVPSLDIPLCALGRALGRGAARALWAE
jgi:hypothetical protein